MRIRLVSRISSIDSEAWDALAGDDDPFVEHSFLRALEDSGSVGSGTGWAPLHVTVWDDQKPRGSQLVAALPLYVKEHSFGEYIFDWAWADYAARIGVPYYPKLVSMVPVTPATGSRLLIAPGALRHELVSLLIKGCFEAIDRVDASSLHMLFLNDQEQQELACDPRLKRRLSMQFHWENQGYSSFDDFLSTFRSSKRKQVRKERLKVADSDVAVRVLLGEELSASDWAFVYALYCDTCARRGSYPYLSERFFEATGSGIAKRAVVVMAYHRGEPIAASLSFHKGRHLYGRYWGCADDYAYLHFELCYYQLIEWAIAHGVHRFEAGAQGGHKLARGFVPAPVHSVHWIRDSSLRHVVEQFLPQEAMHVSRSLMELRQRCPFHR